MKTSAFLSAFLIISASSFVSAQKTVDPMVARMAAADADEFGGKREAFYLPNTLVKPPVPGWEVQKKLYTVNATDGGTIACESGTRIYIPSEAFVDEQGHKISGCVQIDYREYKDPIDFAFSGIPMTYDSGGVSNTFESAGMFDIAASQNGQQVYLAKDKRVSLDFVSTDASTSYNFYVLDDKKGTWVNKGKTQTPRIVQTDMEYTAYSQAVSSYLRHLNSPTPWIYDTTLLASRFTDTSYFFDRLKHPEDRKLVNTSITASDLQRSNGKYKSQIRFSRVSDPVKGEVAFQMKFNRRQFPELSMLSAKKWVLLDQETPASFRAKYGYRNVFGDIRIEESGEGYAITLKTSTGFVTLNAYPISDNALARKDHGPRDNTRLTAVYEKNLMQKEKTFNKEVVKESKEQNKKLIRTDQEYWAWLKKKQMLPEEKAMSFENWKTYCAECVKKEKETVLASGASGSAIIRSLELDGMGVYNCDQIQRLNNPVVAHPKYKEPDGKPLHTSVTFIVDSKINSVLRYDGYNGFNPGRIAYSPSSENLLITVRDDGKVAFADKNSFKAETDVHGEYPDFAVNEVDPAKMSVNDFRKMVGFK